MRARTKRYPSNRKAAAVKPLFALVSLILSVIWLWNNAALCVASTSHYAASVAGSANAAPACHCLKCSTMGSMGSMHGALCCCAKKTTGQNQICMRALCDSQEEALARAVWLPPTLPVAQLILCSPPALPVAPTPTLPPIRLTARSVAPLFPPPRVISPVKKNRRFPLS